jgi:hypothetical protein
MDIYEACKSGNIARLTELLDQGTNVNQEDHKMTPIIYAVLFNRLEIVRLLLDRGANINHRDYTNNTPLQRSIYVDQEFLTDYQHDENYNEIIKLLVNRGADLNTINNYNETPLSGLIWENNIELIQFLIDNGADVNFNNPILLAIRRNNIEIVRLLLDNGANPNIGWSAALRDNNIPIFDLLMDPIYKQPEPVEPVPNPEENLRVARTICSICQELKNYNTTDSNSPYIIHSLVCGHTFHNICITQWILRQERANLAVKCPLCDINITGSARVMLGGSINYYNKYQKYLNKKIN